MKKYIKSIRIIYFLAMISPLMIIGVYSITVEKGTILLNNDMDGILRYLIPVFAMIVIPIGFLISGKRLKEIYRDENIDSKLNAYKGITIQRIAFIEGIAFLSAIAFMITLNYLYLVYTLLVLMLFLFIYPTMNKINKQIGIQPDGMTEEPVDPKKSTNFFGKHPWVVIPIIVVLLLANYNSFHDFFSNKVVLPSVKADCGILKDSIYTNDYLGWTIIVPSGYSVIPTSVLEKNERIGNELLGEENTDDEKPIRLLNVSNGLVDFTSCLNPKVLFPNLTSEEKYLEILDGKINKMYNTDSIQIKKSNIDEILIDRTKFKYVEYIITIKEKGLGIIFFTKFNKDYIFDIAIAYQSVHEGQIMMTHLKNSKLNWN